MYGVDQFGGVEESRGRPVQLMQLNDQSGRHLLLRGTLNWSIKAWREKMRGTAPSRLLCFCHTEARWGPSVEIKGAAWWLDACADLSCAYWGVGGYGEKRFTSEPGSWLSIILSRSRALTHILLNFLWHRRAPSDVALTTLKILWECMVWTNSEEWRKAEGGRCNSCNWMIRVGATYF